MARKGRVKRKSVIPDPKYGDRIVSKLVAKVMLQGKKSTAEHVVYGAFNIISEKTKEDPLKIFKDAVENLKPFMEVRSRRVGGATYQVPMEVRPDRKVSLALRWLVDFSRGRGEKTMEDRLAGEILEAYENRGTAVRKKEDVHRMAEANKAFAHYRW
ncbi:MAG: 30S ribosomal protein S7 [Deltaproteobacteria bacterium RIFCSPLOWO2_02_FULL_50_16]|nr:MAG: 30S ribosomal protein S7 [Deltaproteobacteria bacterium RIFCSPHIGHO2_02_FULL_50_15]OGQ55941.1 MAG: 30S ribosomal protein S7 [Deltaproteobacteria bacterium RIFCSPLOWO2_02_FULL_50_16]